jgi:predicted RNA methylase
MVLDVGTGSGIMAIYAARAGAEHVFAVEKDPRMADIAERNFERNGFSDRITLIVGDALKLRKDNLGMFMDMIVGELLSTWCVVEPQVPVFKHLLGVNGPAITIPNKIVNVAEGVHATFGDVEGLVDIPTIFFEFKNTWPKAKGITQMQIASEIAFSADMADQAEARVELKAKKEGVINALRLMSLTQTCEGVFFNPSDDTMPRMIVPLSHEIPLQAGEQVSFVINYIYGGGWDKFSVKRTG